MSRRGAQAAAMLVGVTLVAACSAGEGAPTTTPPATTATTTTATPTTTISANATTTVVADATPCPSFSPPRSVGTVASAELDEISGLAVGRRASGVLWAHNDSGDVARVYALSPNGSLIGTVGLAGVVAFDWEDMAIGPAPGGGTFLYVADIGDNLRIRPTVVVHRFAEPEVTDPETTVEAETLVLTYPDGPHDAEALLVDPFDEELVIITKAEGRVYTAPAGEFGTRIELTLRTTLAVDDLVTGAAIDAGGSRIFVRTPDRVLLWRRPSGQSVEQAFQQQPCELPAPDEDLGEAIAATADGGTFFTISEGAFPEVFAADDR